MTKVQLVIGGHVVAESGFDGDDPLFAHMALRCIAELILHEPTGGMLAGADRLLEDWRRLEDAATPPESSTFPGGVAGR